MPPWIIVPPKPGSERRFPAGIPRLNQIHNPLNIRYKEDQERRSLKSRVDLLEGHQEGTSPHGLSGENQRLNEAGVRRYEKR
jgi:hypothetical protein